MGRAGKTSLVCQISLKFACQMILSSPCHRVALASLKKHQKLQRRTSKRLLFALLIVESKKVTSGWRRRLMVKLLNVFCQGVEKMKLRMKFSQADMERA